MVGRAKHAISSFFAPLCFGGLPFCVIFRGSSDGKEDHQQSTKTPSRGNYRRARDPWSTGPGESFPLPAPQKMRWRVREAAPHDGLSHCTRSHYPHSLSPVGRGSSRGHCDRRALLPGLGDLEVRVGGRAGIVVKINLHGPLAPRRRGSRQCSRPDAASKNRTSPRPARGVASTMSASRSSSLRLLFTVKTGYSRLRSTFQQKSLSKRS
jgi:hypothetical protein